MRDQVLLRIDRVSSPAQDRVQAFGVEIENSRRERQVAADIVFVSDNGAYQRKRDPFRRVRKPVHRRFSPRVKDFLRVVFGLCDGPESSGLLINKTFKNAGKSVATDLRRFISAAFTIGLGSISRYFPIIGDVTATSCRGWER